MNCVYIWLDFMYVPVRVNESAWNNHTHNYFHSPKAGSQRFKSNQSPQGGNCKATRDGRREALHVRIPIAWSPLKGESSASTNRTPWLGPVVLSRVSVSQPQQQVGEHSGPHVCWQKPSGLALVSPESIISRYFPASLQSLAFSLQDWGGGGGGNYSQDFVWTWPLREMKREKKFQAGLWEKGVDDSTADALSS